MRLCRMHRLALILATLPVAIAAPAAERPHLVLQITVDQLRGDQLPRYRDKFTGGFKWLLNHGLYYANAHYQTANTFTAAGHAVLVTGADTPEHGMVANEWWDRASGKEMYCTFDPAHPVLGEPAKPGAGMSPANLQSTTIGDEIAAARRGRAFAVAGKDRSAIIPGGHLGKALWWSEKTGGFVTSTYYFDALPNWVSAWNDRKEFSRYRSIDWKPLHETASYLFAPNATNPVARPNRTLGKSFPHPLQTESEANFLSMFRFTPFLDELTAAFAEELIAREKIGQRNGTDYLSISFSATDYIGHAYGPDSMEAEDNLLRLDATLADLLATLDRTIGLDHVLIVLSADHGVDGIPESARAEGFDADRMHPDKLKDEANAALKHRFGTETNLIAAFVPPGFYLDQEILAAAKLEPEKVESALVDFLRGKPGIAYAFSKTDLLTGRLAHTPLLDRVQRSFHPTRSGDVVIVQDQFWYLYPDADAFAAMHGSPYNYDTFVPILWCDPALTKETSYEAVSPNQIAPTIAAVLGVKAPSGSAIVTLLPGAIPTASPQPMGSDRQAPGIAGKTHAP